MKKILIFIFGIAFLIAGCEDKKKSGSNELETDNHRDELELELESEFEQQSKHDDEKDIESNYPEITNDNVVEFLTEYGKENPETGVLIETDLGDIEITLYEDTPLHRANFIYLVKENYFEETVFHRVVPDFIIQAGNSDMYSTQKKRAEMGKNYLLPAEIIPGRIHEYGTVSGAKEYRENPDKRTAPYEFFIFLGPLSSTSHLNGNYTIFGRVTKGMDVVEKISELEADDDDWPQQNVYLKASVIE